MVGGVAAAREGEDASRDLGSRKRMLGAGQSAG